MRSAPARMPARRSFPRCAVLALASRMVGIHLLLRTSQRDGWQKVAIAHHELPMRMTEVDLFTRASLMDPAEALAPGADLSGLLSCTLRLCGGTRSRLLPLAPLEIAVG